MRPISCSDLPLLEVAGGVRIAVRLTPRSRTDRLDGIATLANGALALRASVTSPPVDSRANDALLQLLAKEWGLPRRDLAIVDEIADADRDNDRLIGCDL